MQTTTSPISFSAPALARRALLLSLALLCQLPGVLATHAAAEGRHSRGSGAFLASGARRDAERDLREALDQALGAGPGGLDEGLRRSIAGRLEVTWRSMPKNALGRVDRRSLRYIVHRYFLQAYSLSVTGLEPLQANSSREEIALLMDFAPAYVKTALEGGGAQQGLSLDDVVHLVAAIEHLVDLSSFQLVEDLYGMQGRDPSVALSTTEAQELMERFLLRWWLSNEGEHFLQELEENLTEVQHTVEHWADVSVFARGMVSSFAYSRRLGTAPSGKADDGLAPWTPLRPVFTLESMQHIAGGVARNFGRFWQTECSRVKGLLTALDPRATGRVGLSSFYREALRGEWRFSESQAYLRQLGALDETSDWRGPQLLITNYMQAPSNCIASREHYRVCCANECEDYMDELEAAVGAPEAEPEALWGLARGLRGDGPQLPAKLRTRLLQISAANGGRVPLHGRLFAQWLHYAFPHECPFPHPANSTTNLAPFEFRGFRASRAEMVRLSRGEGRNASGEPPAEEDWMTQWSHEEELLVLDSQGRPPLQSVSTLALLVLVAALVAAGWRKQGPGGACGHSRGREALPMHCDVGKML